MVRRDLAAGNQFAAIVESCLDGKLDFGADVAGQFFHADDIAWGYPVLFSAGFDNRVHANLDWEPEHTECVGTTGVNISVLQDGPAIQLWLGRDR